MTKPAPPSHGRSPASKRPPKLPAVTSSFQRLGLTRTPTGHRRVLAVLAQLRDGGLA